MNKKRWVVAALAAFAVYFVLEMVLHGILLGDLYRETATVWRSEPQMRSLMWTLWLVYAVQAAVLAFIYTKGYEPGKSGIKQGMRFGIALGLLLATMKSLGSYFSLPIPALLASYWFVGELIITTVAGVAIGAIYRR